MLRNRISSAIALSALAIGLAPAPAHSVPGAVGAPGTADAIQVVSRADDGDRVVRYRVSTPSLERSATTTLRVNVILPAGYRESTDRHYPVLYALPGTSNLADVWLSNIETIKLTRD